MSDSPGLEAAALRARAARERLFGTAHELQARLDPARLLDDAVETVRTNATGLAETTVEAARRRPGVATAAIVASAAVLLRRPLIRLGRRMIGRPKATD